MQRPDKIRAKRSGGFADVELSFDGKTLTLLRQDPGAVTRALQRDATRSFGLTVVSNVTPQSRVVAEHASNPEEAPAENLGLSWPNDIYSLAHVALPFPPDDPVYGVLAPAEGRGIRLGNLALRGERGVLQISASDMLRLRWNPFYSYVEQRILAFLDLQRRHVGRSQQ